MMVLVSGKRITTPSPDCIILNLASDRYVRLVYDFSNQHRAALFCSSICGRPLKEPNDIERSSGVNPDVCFAIILFVLPKYWEYARLPNNDQTNLSQAFEKAIACQE